MDFEDKWNAIPQKFSLIYKCFSAGVMILATSVSIQMES